MDVYLALFGFGLVSGMLANHRGRAIHPWFLVGLVSGPIALGLLLYLPKGEKDGSDYGLPGL